MTVISFKYNDLNGKHELIEQLTTLFSGEAEIVVVCVGSDRTAGDSLGPLVGTLIQEHLPTAPIYGSLQEPVHALNLSERLRMINCKHPKAFILAVDACLGTPERIGMISFRTAPLMPGIGLKKILPRVGHASLIGIINSAGFFSYRALKNTRMRFVYFLAKTIAESITQALINSQNLTNDWQVVKHEDCCN